MAKRRAEDVDLNFQERGERQVKLNLHGKKHTLDSDEDDSDDEERYNVMNENEIEGEEEGISQIEGDVKFTPFNMKEELEEGHFDLEGHFHWDKTKEIKDNWLDNIDWVKVKTDTKYVDKGNSGLVDSGDSDDDESVFSELGTYKKILELMQPGETISKTLQRFGKKSVALSSVEKWKRKKAGFVDENAELVTKLTALANSILTKTGNMDIYEETYEMIEDKIGKCGPRQNKSMSGELDMYSDDFDDQEKNKLSSKQSQDVCVESVDAGLQNKERNNIQWEFKWKQDATEVYGPYPTEQMLNWVEEGYFKDGVFVRKVGKEGRFYSSNRIDFDLYI